MCMANVRHDKCMIIVAKILFSLNNFPDLGGSTKLLVLCFSQGSLLLTWLSSILMALIIDQHCIFLGTGWLSKNYKLNVQTGQVLLEEINSNFFFTRPDSY